MWCSSADELIYLFMASWNKRAWSSARRSKDAKPPRTARFRPRSASGRKSTTSARGSLGAQAERPGRVQRGLRAVTATPTSAVATSTLRRRRRRKAEGAVAPARPARARLPAAASVAHTLPCLHALRTCAPHGSAPSTVRPLARDLRVLVGWPFPLGFGLDGRLLLAQRGRVYV